MIQNLPNMLTGLRILAIPLMVLCYYLPQPISVEQQSFLLWQPSGLVDGWVAQRIDELRNSGRSQSTLRTSSVDSRADSRASDGQCLYHAGGYGGDWSGVMALQVDGAVGQTCVRGSDGIAKVKTGVRMTAIPILLWYPSWPAVNPFARPVLVGSGHYPRSGRWCCFRSLDSEASIEPDPRVDVGGAPITIKAANSSIGERNLAKVEVASSNLVSRSISCAGARHARHCLGRSSHLGTFEDADHCLNCGAFSGAELDAAKIRRM